MASTHGDECIGAKQFFRCTDQHVHAFYHLVWFDIPGWKWSVKLHIFSNIPFHLHIIHTFDGIFFSYIRTLIFIWVPIDPSFTCNNALWGSYNVRVKFKVYAFIDYIIAWLDFKAIVNANAKGINLLMLSQGYLERTEPISAYRKQRILKI